VIKWPSSWKNTNRPITKIVAIIVVDNKVPPASK